jgi:hypothetical protein
MPFSLCNGDWSVLTSLHAMPTIQYLITARELVRWQAFRMDFSLFKVMSNMLASLKL